MAQTLSDNLLCKAPKQLDDRCGVFASGAWRPFNDINEFNARFVLAARYVNQTFWMKSTADPTKASLWALDTAKNPYNVLSTVDLSNYYTKTETNNLLSLKANVTYVDGLFDELSLDLVDEIEERIAGDLTNSNAIVAETNRAIAVEALKSDKVNLSIFVEDFRNNSLNDEAIWLQQAIDAAGEYGIITFKQGITYSIKSGLKAKKGQTFFGYGATLFRSNESKTTLGADLNSLSAVVTVSSVPSDWKIGDEIHVYTGNSAATTTDKRKIISIVGNVVTLSFRIGTLIGGSETIYPAGTNIRKVYTMIEGLQYPNNNPYIVKGLTFDGNTVNNTGNRWWYLNANIQCYGLGGEISDCQFFNIPNENIICSGIIVSNNYGDNFSGSFVHLSSPPDNLGSDLRMTQVINNRAKRTNFTPFATTGHSRCVIENSWNPGKLIITGNEFEGAVGNDCSAYNFFEKTVEGSGTTQLRDEVICSNNIFKGYSKICDPITIYSTDLTTVKARLISNNIYYDCGATNDFNLLVNAKSIFFVNNQYVGNTAIQNYIMPVDDQYGFNKAIFLSGSNPAYIIRNIANTRSIAMALVGDVLYFQNALTNKLFFSVNLATDKMDLVSANTTVDTGILASVRLNSSTTARDKAYLNTTYGTTINPIGTRVILNTASPQLMYTRVSATEWLDKNGNIVS